MKFRKTNVLIQINLTSTENDKPLICISYMTLKLQVCGSSETVSTEDSQNQFDIQKQEDVRGPHLHRTTFRGKKVDTEDESTGGPRSPDRRGGTKEVEAQACL